MAQTSRISPSPTPSTSAKLLSVVERSTAPVVQFNGSGYAVGIQGLCVNGDYYDVQFVFESFQNLFGMPHNLLRQPLFWQDPALAGDVRDRILQALAASYVLGIAYGARLGSAFSIPVNFEPPGEWWWMRGGVEVVSSDHTDGQGFKHDPQARYAYAVIVPASAATDSLVAA